MKASEASIGLQIRVIPRCDQSFGTPQAVETLIFRARRTLAANLAVEPERPKLLVGA